MASGTRYRPGGKRLQLRGERLGRAQRSALTERALEWRIAFSAMGLFSSGSSSVDTIDGQVRFTPAPPDPRWMRLAEAVTWVMPPILIVLSIAADDVDTLVILIAVFWGVALLSAVGARIAARGKPSPPTDPFEVPEQLLSEVRTLAHDDRDLDALKLVRTELGVGLVDARRIVDAAVGH